MGGKKIICCFVAFKHIRTVYKGKYTCDNEFIEQANTYKVNKMTLNQIKNMTGDECHKALNVIEGNARFTGKPLTDTQKKHVKALEYRVHAIGDEFTED